VFVKYVSKYFVYQIFGVILNVDVVVVVVVVSVIEITATKRKAPTHQMTQGSCT